MKTRYIALAISLFVSLSGIAQHNEEVTIEGTYRPKVNKVDKILMQPVKPQQSFEMPGTEVRVLDIEHRFQHELEKMSPLYYNGSNGQMPEAAKNFLMAGFGSRISPVFLYKHNSNLTKNLGLGVGIKHYSSWLDIKDYAPTSFMNNAFNVGLTSSKYKNVQLGWEVYYKNDMYHYYGFDPQQIYNTIGTSFGLTSTTTRNGEFVNDLNIDYHYLFGKLDGGGKEHSAMLSYDLGYVDSWWGKKNYPQKLGLALGTQYANDQFPGQAGEDHLIFKVNPYFEMKDDFYRLHLGVRMDGATDFVTTTGMLSVHPDLKGSLSVIDNAVEFYAGLNGGRKLFTYSDMITDNPFVDTRLNMEVTTVKLGFEGGIRTHLMKTMDIHVGVRYRHTDNDPFFHEVSATTAKPYNSFDVVYDETRTVSVMGNVRWLATDKMVVDAAFTYNNYKMTNEAHPWFRPGLEGDLKLSYRFTDAFGMNANFLYQGQRWAMNDVFDLGLGADWHVNDQLTVFAKLNNMANQRYQLYYDYPVGGIQAFAGLKIRF